MTESPYGHGHEDVIRIINQARTLTQDQAFAIREDRNTGTSPSWHGLMGLVQNDFRDPDLDARTEVVRVAIEDAVWSATAAWRLKPATGWGHSIGRNAAADAAAASIYAARCAALAAMTAHLMDGPAPRPHPGTHAKLPTAWRAVFPAESEGLRA